MSSISASSATELRAAVAAGNEARTLELLDRGADVNEKSGIHEDTPLHRACVRNHVDLAKILLSRGADANAQDREGRTPLHTIRLHLCCREPGVTPLHDLMMCLHGCPPDVDASPVLVQLVEALLAGGADVEIEDRAGATPLSLARRYGPPAVVRLLEGARSARGARPPPLAAEDGGGMAAEARAGPPAVDNAVEAPAPPAGAAVEVRAPPAPAGDRPDGPQEPAPAPADPPCLDAFYCPISHAVMEDPVLLLQTQCTYERSSLMEALARRPGKDPMTNTSFAGEPVLLPNRALRDAIEQWTANRGAASTRNP